VSSVLDIAYNGTPSTVLEILKVAYGDYGAKSWEVRKYIEDLIRNVRARDYWSEALAVHYHACGPKFRYTHDPAKVELVKSPERMITDIREKGSTLGDCDDVTTFILAGLSVLSAPGRLGTGAFEMNEQMWPQLGMERPENFGMESVGGNYAGGPFTHVWAEGMRPDGVWVLLDPVAGPDAGQMRRRLRQVRYYMKT
jgi:hypothetical protein